MTLVTGNVPLHTMHMHKHVYMRLIHGHKTMTGLLIAQGFCSGQHQVGESLRSVRDACPIFELVVFNLTTFY